MIFKPYIVVINGHGVAVWAKSSADAERAARVHNEKSAPRGATRRGA